MNLKNVEEWREYYKSGNKPNNIPSSPFLVYSGKGWYSFKDWLGTDVSVNPFFDKEENIKYLSYVKAQNVAATFKVKNYMEWKRYIRKNKLPKNVPYNPSSVYRNKGWIGWRHWCGNDFIEFTTLKKIIQEIGIKNRKEYNEFRKKYNK